MTPDFVLLKEGTLPWCLYLKKGGEVQGRIHGKPQMSWVCVDSRCECNLVNWDDSWQGGDLTATSRGRKF